MALDAVIALAVALLLLVAGLEVDLSAVWRQGRSALGIALAGLLVPLVIGGHAGLALAGLVGNSLAGNAPDLRRLLRQGWPSAPLPVIAKVLLDLDLFQTDFGMLALVSATLNNLLVWLIFSVVLSGRSGGHSMGYTIGLTVGFVALMMTVGRWAADRALPWVQAHLAWPGGVLGFVLVTGLVGAAITEAIGIHAIFGRVPGRDRAWRLASSPRAHATHRSSFRGRRADADLRGGHRPGGELRHDVRSLACASGAGPGDVRKSAGLCSGRPAGRAARRRGVGDGLDDECKGGAGDRPGTAGLGGRCDPGAALRRPGHPGHHDVGPGRADAQATLAAVRKPGLFPIFWKADSVSLISRRTLSGRPFGASSAVAAERAMLDPAWVAEAVLRREALRGPGIGHGVAVPDGG